MARKGSVATEVKENAALSEKDEKEMSEEPVPVQKTASVKKAPSKKTSGKKAKADPIPEGDESSHGDENIETANNQQEEAAEEETEQEPSTAPAQKSKKGAKKAEEVKEKKEEEKMPPKRGRAASAKKETEEAVVAAPEAAAEEEEAVAEEPVAKGKGGRKPVAKGKKGKKEEEETKEEEEQKVEEDEKMDAEEEEKMTEEEKPASKGRGGRKAAAAKPAEKDDEMEEEEEVAAAPKKGRKAAAKAADEEPEAKKLKKEEEKKPAAKGRGKKAAEKDEEEKEDANEEEEKEEVQEEKPKGRGRAAKKPEAKAEKEEEEAEKPAGRPKRGAATKSAALAKKIAEDEDDEEDVKPKRGKAAAKKVVAKETDEDEEEEKPAAKGRGKQPAKGRAAKGKKVEAAGDDDEDDGPTSSKKVKVEEDAAADGKSGGKSMTKSIRRTVQVKGKAAVDPMCVRKASSAHVYADGDLIYDVMLNQTNIGNNNNKYYIIQLLEEDDKNEYSVWFRWGRVGYDGQNKLVECGTNLQRAIREFSTKFSDKTRNDWPTAFADFETHHGKYTMIEMDYGNGDGADGSEKGSVKIEDEQEEEEAKCQVVSKLDARVQAAMHLMCSIRTMQQAVKQLEFDADKSPLGKLTQQQIKEGYACLGKIEKFIEKKNFGAEFKMAVNEYYTKVPHACGFRPPALIRTPQLLKSEIELLDLLSGIEYAIKTMKQEKREDDVHPVDRHYASLHCGLAPMEKSEEEYTLVAEYLAKTHGTTHAIQMGLKNVFRVEREGEEGNEEVMEKIGNRKLLWHGSRLSNFFGILSQGLRIAPPEAPCTGYMFGKGVYFADMASKSGNYCYASEDGQTAFLLLAEVALGEEHQLKQADYNADRLPAGKHSTWGIGRTMPDPTQNKKLNDSVAVPCGKPIASPMGGADASLLYNEFIVYNTQQIRMRYLLEVQFTFI